MKYYEMFGLPGAGKTHVLGNTQVKGFKVMLVGVGVSFQKIKMLLGVIFCYPALTIRLFFIGLFHVGFRIKKRLVVLHRFANYLYIIESLENHNGVVDEGIFQAVWGTFKQSKISPKSIASMKYMLSLFLYCDLNVIYMDTPEAIVRSRIQNRLKIDGFKKYTVKQFSVAFEWHRICHDIILQLGFTCHSASLLLSSGDS